MAHSSAVRETDMADQLVAIELVSCHLIITRDAHSEILLVQEGSSLRLPRVEIPMWERAAPHLISTVRELWGVDAICLFNADIGDNDSKPTNVRCYVLEAMYLGAVPKGGGVWVSTEARDAAGLRSMGDFVRIQKALSQATAYDRKELVGPFAHSGWFKELTSWIESQLSTHGWRLGGEWSQYNMGPSFCLIHAATNGPGVWFKAVGKPNLKEYAITCALNQLRSSYLPQILATHDEWHGWLALEISGHRLDGILDIRHWKNAASSLAAMQLESLGSTEALLSAGCKDLRLGHLDSLIDPLIELFAELMKKQCVNPPRILTKHELNILGDALHRTCDRLQSLGFVDTLGHRDLNPGNVIVNADRAVFLDWAEGMIGHPFFTFEYLIALLRSLRPDLEHWTAHLREGYARPWRNTYLEEKIREAFLVTPLLAVLAFAASSSGWQENPHEMDQYRAKLMRSLARRMYAEACKFESNRFLFSISS
jgi:hypothetical protein